MQLISSPHRRLGDFLTDFGATDSELDPSMCRLVQGWALASVFEAGAAEPANPALPGVRPFVHAALPGPDKARCRDLALRGQDTQYRMSAEAPDRRSAGTASPPSTVWRARGSRGGGGPPVALRADAGLGALGDHDPAESRGRLNGSTLRS